MAEASVAGIGGLPASIILPLIVYTTVTNENGTTAKVLDGTKLIAVGSRSLGSHCNNFLLTL